MFVENRTKIANFPTPVHLTPPMKGFPVEFGIGVRAPKCLNDGPTRWSKKVSDRFRRFDTIPAVTDSQPASHVAVAITLNAKASSLKTDYPALSDWVRYHFSLLCLFCLSYLEQRTQIGLVYTVVRDSQ